VRFQSRQYSLDGRRTYGIRKLIAIAYYFENFKIIGLFGYILSPYTPVIPFTQRGFLFLLKGAEIR